MNTEYAIGNFRLRFESRASRRRFVAIFYTVLVAFDLIGLSNSSGFSVSAKTVTSTWVSVGCMILFVLLFIVFTGVSGDVRARGDERETHRRDHAHFKAYYFPIYVLIAALFATYFKSPNAITLHMSPAQRGILIQLPNFLTMSAFLLYITLPRAILLWTEPDMEDPQTAQAISDQWRREDLKKKDNPHGLKPRR
jgi:hypothetical protein